MKKTAYIHELLNSGVTLNAKERKTVERYIASVSKPVKPQHLNHWKAVAACRTIDKRAVSTENTGV